VNSSFQLYVDRKRKGAERSDFITQMLESPDLAENDKTLGRLALEARGLVGAGTETTGHTLSVITFYLSKNPEKLRRLKDELSNAHKSKGGVLEYQDLQRLPYLVSKSPSTSECVIITDYNSRLSFSSPCGMSLMVKVTFQAINLPKFRISTGAAGRLPRVNPRDALQYKQYLIPKGVSSRHILT
jgi:cytochrome P450